ncbi:MAG: multidrug efflux RND transporter permease subunit [Planctomycetota bacterium]|jgi:multidrug efflux pump
MNISRLFILRPVATVLSMVAILLSGWLAYRQLPVAALPQVDYPTIQVVTFYPGAGPEVMTSSVTAPLEKQFGQIPGLQQMTSSSTQGCSVITLQFALELNIDVAVQQVQASINVASNFLPRDLPNPPIYSKVNPADAPVLTLSLSSDTIPLPRIQDLADTRLAQKLSQVKGVGQVTVSGGQKPAIRVQANPTSLSAVNLTLDDLRVALVAANVNQAKGSFDGPKQSIIIGANDQLFTADQFRELIVAYRAGAPIKLSDVANVVEDVENIRQAAWRDTTPAVLLNIQRQPGANIIDVVDRIQEILPQLKESLPAAIRVDVLTDRTTTIRASVESVQHELLLTIGLVVLVIFLFLHSPRATIIPSAAVPLSIVGTFGIMYLLGYTLNNLTLMALTISTGFVVDDAIVMIENIMRYIEEGMEPLPAALRGASEIGFTIVSLSVSLVAVLIPLLFMGDVVGRLFREFAVTLSVTIFVSAIVSLTLTPMMCAFLLKRKTKQELQQHREEAQGWFFQRLLRFYDVTLRWTLRHQRFTMMIFLATLAATIFLYIYIPKGFFPLQDSGVILGTTATQQDASFDRIREKQSQLNAILADDPAVESIASFIGIDGINLTLNNGRIQINLKPHHDRKESIAEVMARLSDKAAVVEGIDLFLQPVQDLSVETRVSRTQYQYSLESANPAELQEWIPRVVDKLRQQPELRDVASDQAVAGKEALLVIDRDTASRLGVTPLMIDDALYNAFGQRQVSTIFTQLNQYRVVLEVLPEFRNSLSDIGSMYVKTTTGRSTPLESLTRVDYRDAPLSINHQGQFPVVTISFNVAPGVSLGQAVEAVEKSLADLEIPRSMIGAFQGAAQAYQRSLSTTPLLILAALVTVYIVLGVLYESYIHPLTILSTLPSAGVGALVALQLVEMDLGVIAIIGIILLIGIVKKNAIMMIDFSLEAQRNQGLSAENAIFQASLLRLRPILMTTMAALLGAVPLAFSFGVGAELRQPLGICIIGGLIFSQALTLYTTPVIYLWFDRFSRDRSKAAETSA